MNKKQAKNGQLQFKDGPEELTASAGMLCASAHDRDAGGLHADVQHNHGRYFIIECIESLALLFVASVTFNLVSLNLV